MVYNYANHKYEAKYNIGDLVRFNKAPGRVPKKYYKIVGTIIIDIKTICFKYDHIEDVYGVIVPDKGLLYFKESALVLVQKGSK